MGSLLRSHRDLAPGHTRLSADLMVDFQPVSGALRGAFVNIGRSLDLSVSAGATVETTAAARYILA